MGLGKGLGPGATDKRRYYELAKGHLDEVWDWR